ncbi:NADPH-dependent FMN reductase [Baaleninema simplex]|uniref:NADPH-dependent FMN reductase n=1 Tax=Baaleninema simplex TaxID=2862350 RepID=UPI0004781DBB|nr:NAD(P)H-dependent oxidoreductase [Baaleninema simplex]
MSDTPKILAFAGSARDGSFNKKLVKIAASGAEAAGAKVTYLDFRELPLPLYDEDLEAKSGIPDNAMQLKALMKSHQGFLISCPEYNSSITPLLKNAIDWASRSEPGEPPLALTCFRGKAAAIMSVSPGGFGGMRGLVHVRDILGNIGVLVLPGEKSISNAYEAFDESDRLKNEKQQAAVEDLGKQLAEVLAKLS